MKLTILPGRIALPAQPQTRRHRPEKGMRKDEWQDYRRCLRWDFGFTCPFCLLHESDLAEHGAVGENKITVEHREFRSKHPHLANQYENTFLACSFCNGSRGDRYPAVDDSGRKLLDPTRVAWADHFEWQGDALRPKSGDSDAGYTWEAYNLDGDKKRKRLQWRRQLIDRAQSLLKEVPLLITQLNRSARTARKQGDTHRALQKLKKAREWQRILETTAEELLRFRVIPRDAPDNCRCDDGASLRLPDWLVAQIVEVDLPRMAMTAGATK